ncbi:TPA: cell filamentation protein Fic [Candidatus Uhrbacteria bacterium]|nr:cell filamentation protein Fic [Candidatus Uhrbacteria bacterium]
MNELTPKPDFILYTSQDGDVKFEVFLQDETIWLTQKMMAELFGVDVRTINEHLQNIYKSRELSDQATVRNFRIVQKEGDRDVEREISFYNLDAIISVGYRVNSARATQFRIWATRVLREYIVKGFAMNDERLKQGERVFGKDYFKELLERVRSIRASERRIYLQITDIFAECSVDYDPHADVTKDFFATVQNTFHFAITGQTAAEIIYAKADKTKPNMGLTTWKHSPTGRVLATDVKTAKNYLEEADIKRLERTVSGFFDYVENVIENNHAFTMAEFAQSVNKFLTFNEYRILDGKGTISMSQAEQKALSEYKEFNKTQKIESDFEKEVKKIRGDHAKEDASQQEN